VDELLAALTVEMTVVSVRVSISPLTNLRLKAVQVVEGPVQLEFVAKLVAHIPGTIIASQR
jgi:hypothetical protein